MKIHVLALVLISGLWTSCVQETSQGTVEPTTTEKVVTPEEVLVEINDLERAFFAAPPAERMTVNTNLLQACEKFVQLFPRDPKAPDVLFQAGNAAVNGQQFEKGQALYERLVTNYHTYDKIPEVLYMQGFIYESELEQMGKAKEKYAYIIERYPNHELAAQAQLSIDNFGKTDEEIVRSFNP